VSAEEFSRKLDAYNDAFVRRIQTVISEFDGLIRNWNRNDEWEIRQIDRLGSGGYSIQDGLGLDQPSDPLNPFEPLYPLKRRPGPKRPFEVLQHSLKEASEPLADVFEDEKAIKIYFELRGAKQENIQLNATRANVQVKAENLFKAINLPHNNVDLESASSKFKNGVLEITIPTKEKSSEKDTVKIEIN
jgi:HSP20 family molecular chaperone IbpA